MVYLACVPSVIQLRLVTSAKQSLFGLNELPHMRFEFPWPANRQRDFWQASHGGYSNAGIWVAAQNKDFGAISQTDLTRSLVSSAEQAS